MKGQFKIFVISWFIMLSVGQVYSQCSNCNYNYPSGTATNTSATCSTIATLTYGGDYTSENVDPAYEFDWAETADSTTPDVEMIRSSSVCTTTSSSQYVSAGSSYTITHGTTSCCSSNARLRYYNASTSVWTYGSYGTDVVSYTVTSAASGTYTYQTYIYGSNGTSYCSSSYTVYVIPCGNTYLGTLSPGSCSMQNANYTSGTIPYWSFYATSGYTYNFSLGGQNTEDSYLHLYNSSMTQVTTNDDSGPFYSGIPSSLSYTCTASGTYYITASHLSCTVFTNSSYMTYWKTNDPYGHTTPVSITPTTSWQNYAYTSGSIYMFGFSATSGAIYDFSLCSNTEDSYLRIYDSNHQQLTTYDDNGPHCSGIPASASWTAPSTGQFYVQISNYSCDGFTNSGNFAYRVACTPPTAPTGVTNAGTTLCSGSSVTLTATGGSTGSGCTYQWYAGGCGSGSVLGTGSSLIVSPTSTTTYYVRRIGNSPCDATVTICTSGVVTVHSVSIAPTSINAVVNP